MGAFFQMFGSLLVVNYLPKSLPLPVNVFPLLCLRDKTSHCFMSCCFIPHSSLAVVVSLSQTALQEGEKRRLGLQVALSHHVFLADCLKAEQTQRMEREAAEALRETETRTASLNHRLEVRMLKQCFSNFYKSRTPKMLCTCIWLRTPSEKPGTPKREDL